METRSPLSIEAPRRAQGLFTGTLIIGIIALLIGVFSLVYYLSSGVDVTIPLIVFVIGLLVFGLSLFGAKTGVKEQIKKDDSKIDMQIRKINESLDLAERQLQAKTISQDQYVEKTVPLRGRIKDLEEMKRQIRVRNDN